ncbi:class I SAM-dependent methyltransferase [Thermogemmatispora tikiterensis]|uniref:Methyltransferase domain-containing protein n=1 Tax=Thermogemmatispora tikiterensis TaxID=1825093 RepID=A0A328VBY6_9CHLR|nr:class I SAM-dependent methyltransferase [Thermogemmatispora tikiterensis]RAQ94319.1 hypothetical protein A4R35_02165 [Thermogemmatispora tikiterensis]
MPWWFFRRKSAAAPTSHSQQLPDAPSPARPRSWAGEVTLPSRADAEERRYLEEQPYLLPKDLKEVNRLDFQHYILRAILRRNYLAPLQEQATRQILDVGCGTGQWAYEVAKEFPQASVVGLDVEQAKNSVSPPPNYRFVQGDALNGLPFNDNTFDFVHQRFLTAALPLPAWPQVVRELVRVTARGGWVELLEASTEIAPVGPATQRVLTMTLQLTALRGLDGSGEVARSLDRYLREAGLVQVQRHDIEVPLGDWGGRIGSLLALDFREVGTALSGAVVRRFQMAPPEYQALLDAVFQECNQLKTMYRFVAAYGQKP